MNKDEARELLRERLRKYRDQPHSLLVEWVNENRRDRYEVTVPSGTRYQLEIEFLWDDKPNVRVLGAIDDGGLSALRPICEDFIKAPDGQFVGE